MLRLAPVALCLAACATAPAPRALDFFAGPALVVAGGDDVVIAGLVTDANTEDPLVGALVYLQCTCLKGHIELTTDADGIYRVVGLPSGKYTVQVLYEHATVNKVMYMPPHAMLRADYDIDLDVWRGGCSFEMLPRRFTTAQPWVLVGNLDLPLDPPRP